MCTRKQPSKYLRPRVRIIFKSSQSLVKLAFASLFFALWYYFGTKVSCAGIVSFTPEAMLFSTQNIHLENAGRVQQESKEYQQGQVGKGNVHERNNSSRCQDVCICSWKCGAF